MPDWIPHRSTQHHIARIALKWNLESMMITVKYGSYCCSGKLQNIASLGSGEVAART